MVAHLKQHNLADTDDHDFSGIVEDRPLIISAAQLQTASYTVAQAQNAVDLAHAQQHGFGSLSDHDFTGFNEDEAFVVSGGVLTTAGVFALPPGFTGTVYIDGNSLILKVENVDDVWETELSSVLAEIEFEQQEGW